MRLEKPVSFYADGGKPPLNQLLKSMNKDMNQPSRSFDNYLRNGLSVSSWSIKGAFADAWSIKE